MHIALSMSLIEKNISIIVVIEKISLMAGLRATTKKKKGKKMLLLGNSNFYYFGREKNYETLMTS